MAIGSGLGASFGVIAEAVFDTFLAPTRFYQGKTFGVKKTQNVQPLTGVAAGRLAPLDEVVTTTGTTGSLTVEVLRKDFGLLFAHIMGSSTAPVQQGATAAYLQTHAAGDNFGKSLTIQAGVPSTLGTVAAYTSSGTKITKATFSCAVDGLLELALEFDGRTFSDAQTLATASYTASNAPFHFAELGVRMGTFGSEAAVTGVKGVTVDIVRPMKVDRYYAGGLGKKSEQITNGFLEITGTLEVDNVTKADFVDRFTGHTSTSLVIEWMGTTAIASTFYPEVGIRMPKVYFGGDVPDVNGPDVVSASVPFTAFVDATNGLASLRYMSTDIAV